MRRWALFLLFVLCAPAVAQVFTTVSGTVIDPNGIPYANGTIVPTLVSSASPTLNGLSYTPPSGPVGLNSAGSFVMNLANQASLLPGGTTWTFNVCSASGTVQPAGGTGPQCFVVTGIVVAGTSQSISAQLQAAALALTTGPGSNAVIKNPSGGQTVTSSSTDGIHFEMFPCANLNATSTLNQAGCAASFNTYVVNSVNTTQNNLRKGLNVYFQSNAQQGAAMLGLQVNSGLVLDANSVATGSNLTGITSDASVNGTNVTIPQLYGMDSRPRLYNNAHVSRLVYYHGETNNLPAGTTVDLLQGIAIGSTASLATVNSGSGIYFDSDSFPYGMTIQGSTRAGILSDSTAAKSGLCHGTYTAGIPMVVTEHDCWLAAVTFATLPALNNGSYLYCSDCNSTCTAGGGTGRMCFRENGAWTH